MKCLKFANLVRIVMAKPKDKNQKITKKHRGNFFKHKWQKILLIFLLIILSIILILAFFVNRYWSPILASKLKSTVLPGTEGFSTFDFRKAKLPELRGE